LREQELLLEHEKTRQQFQRTFQEQMEQYRSHGTLPSNIIPRSKHANPKRKSKRRSKSSSSNPTLETVSIEPGTSEDEQLEKFLADSDNDKLDKFLSIDDAPDTTHPAGKEENSSESDGDSESQNQNQNPDQTSRESQPVQQENKE